jgi:hypothetical protein
MRFRLKFRSGPAPAGDIGFPPSRIDVFSYVPNHARGFSRPNGYRRASVHFDMEIERLPIPKGDRVKITMSGKFLPYKYYGNPGNVREYGYKKA